jgi:acetyltransferase
VETHALLAAFGLPVARLVSADSLAEALAAARRLGYPVSLHSEDGAQAANVSATGRQRSLRDGRMLTRAWAALYTDKARAPAPAAVVVRKERDADARLDFAIGVHPDPVFGPVITFGIAGAVRTSERTVLLPPLNLRLARDLIRGTRAVTALQGFGDVAAAVDPLADVLVQLSALVCALPWVRSLTLDPVRVGDGRAEIMAARITIDPRAKSTGRSYGHMAIHPYPVEMVSDVVLRDGMRLHVRPIRPEDAEMERAFVNGLSEQTRYLRFFYQLHELTPAMLARFTQVDYDREMALVAVDDAGGASAIVGVARYVMGPDQEAAEFAVVVADAWQRRGVARALMTRLIAAGRTRGLKRLEGAVLRSNHNMLKFTQALGFVTRDHPDDRDQVSVALDLGSAS